MYLTGMAVEKGEEKMERLRLVIDQAVEAETVEETLEHTEEAIVELKTFLAKLGRVSEEFREVA